MILLTCPPVRTRGRSGPCCKDSNRATPHTACTTSAHLHLPWASLGILAAQVVYSAVLFPRLTTQWKGMGEEVTLQLQKGQVLGSSWSRSLPCTYNDKHKAVVVVHKHNHSSYTCFHFGFHLQLQTFLQQGQLNTGPWDNNHCQARLSGADCDRFWLQFMLMRTRKVFCIE